MSNSIDPSTYKVTVTYVIPKAWFVQILKKGYSGPSGSPFFPSLEGIDPDPIEDESDTEIDFILPDPNSPDFLASWSDMLTKIGKLNKIKMIWEQTLFELIKST